jgi:hypothetical protein
MAQFILHTPQVWSFPNLTLQERVILNYLWAWKSRGNPITVNNSYLCELYNMRSLDVAQIIQTLHSKRLIDITHYTSGGRVIYCLPLNDEKNEGPDDIFDHLY